jgi:hypothetical protein
MLQHSAESPTRIIFDVLLILILGAAVITIAVAAWAQPIRDSIKKNAPHIALHYFLEHQKPHVPNLDVPRL